MKICKVCFKTLEDEIFINDLLSVKDHTLCYSCFLKMDIIYKNIYFSKYKIFVLIKYNNFIKELIYKYKGLYDYELRTIFLEYFIDELQDKYRSYTLAFAPSFKLDDEKRGFNHVQEIFYLWRGKKINCFFKKENIKQSSQNYKNRKNIKDFIDIDYSLIDDVNKLLIVDDIVTSGSTLISCYKLAKKANIKKVKMLAVCLSRH